MTRKMVQPSPQPLVDALLILFPRLMTSIKSFQRVQVEIFFCLKNCLISYLSCSLSLLLTFHIQAFTTFEKCRLGMAFGTKRSGCFSFDFQCYLWKGNPFETRTQFWMLTCLALGQLQYQWLQIVATNRQSLSLLNISCLVLFQVLNFFNQNKSSKLTQ